MEPIMEQLKIWVASYGLKVIGALVILIGGRIVAGIMRSVFTKIMHKANVDKSIISFVSGLIYILIITFAVVAALSKFGIQTASFIAILGAAGFAVGLALQGSLANFAAGVLILIFRPFKVGDFVDAAGVAGTIKAIQLFTTELASPDNIKIIVPNGKILGETIKNISGYDLRRVDMVIGIGYTSSIPKAIEIMTTIIKKDARVQAEPALQIAVAELADSSVNFVVRPWVKKEDYWGVKFDLTRQIKEAFDEQGIEIPFPQRSIHMVAENSVNK